MTSHMTDQLPIRVGGGKAVVICPRHGEWVFPHPSVEAEPFAVTHAHCRPVDPQMLRQAAPRRKSRRAPLIQVVHQLAAAATPDVDEGRSAPSHMGITLGFAPASYRVARYAPGPVRL